jgi:undecaprenyl-diphosphatase
LDLLQIIVLALIQGITEFLPISSSAHLILPKEILGWPDQGLVFDVAVHVGSLLAVLIYFFKDILTLITEWCRSVVTRQQTASSRLGWMIIVATIPTGLAGLLFNDVVATHFRSILVIMITTICFGVYLGYADWRGKRSLDLTQLTMTMAIFIGLSQALALIPGTSRSGITMATALLLGLQRESAARFSFLLSIPIIVLSGLFEGVSLLEQDQSTTPNLWRDLLLGASVAGVSAFVCIHFFLRFIQRIGMMPFVIYRLVLGAVLAGILFIR